MPVPVRDDARRALRAAPRAPHNRGVTATFAELGVPAALLAALERTGVHAPFPVQTRALPPALAGDDLLVSAETGSGKTLVFLLAAGAHLGDARATRPRAVVLAPTRELAAQIARVASTLFAETGLRVALLAGGAPVAPQIRTLRSGSDIVVATPGRLLDVARRGAFDAGAVALLVIDEADRMLDLGFLPDVRRCVALLPAARQTLLLSATLPAEVEELAAGLLRDPVRVRAESEEARPLPHGITHVAHVVRVPLKTDLLEVLLRGEDVGRALVFTSSRRRAAVLASELARRGVASDALHAGRSQEDRDAALAAFRGGALRALVATDLAERGLDLPGLTHVVNFDLPGTADRYAHRVGRTARAFGTGSAITLCAPAEEPALDALAAALGVAIGRARVAGFEYEARPRGRDPFVEERRAHAAARDAVRPKRRRAPSPERQRQQFWERARERRRDTRGPGRG